VRDRLSELEFEQLNGLVLARLSGEVDGSNAVELGRAIGQRIPSSAHGLVLDLTGLAYLDSAGIEVLFALARRLGDRRQRLRLGVPLRSPVRRVLELSDIARVAPMEESSDVAAARLMEL
jgi:anti-sigma B factor antagonist